MDLRRSPILLSLLMITVLGITTPTAGAQGILDRLKKAAEDAQKKGQPQKAPQPTQPKPTTPPPANAPAPAPAPTAGGARTNAPAAPAANAPVMAPNLPASTAKVDVQVVAPGIADAASGTIRSTTPVYSPHGVHIATILQRGSRWVVNMDGMDGARYDEILSPQFTVYDMDGSVVGVNERVVFSPDGTRYMYFARLAQEFVAVVDGKEVFRTPVAGITIGPVAVQANAFWPETAGAQRQGGGFTPNGKHYFFGLHTAKTTIYDQLVWDGQITTGQGANGIFLSMDAAGDHYAYFINNPANISQRALIVDGKPAGFNTQESPLFTANGQHIFAVAPPVNGRSGQEYLLDGKSWVRADHVQLYMAPLGDRVIGVITVGVPFNPGGGQFLHVDGKRAPGTDCGMIHDVKFSADGKHYAADCETNAKSHLMIIDGKRGQEYSNIVYYGFTPDSSKSVYVANSGSKSFAVIADQESDGYTGIINNNKDFKKSPIVYGAGGKRTGFTSGAEPDGVCVVQVDDKITKLRAPVCAHHLAFSPDGAHYTYLKGLLNATGIVVDGVDIPGPSLAPFASRLYEGGRTNQLDQFVVFSPDSQHIAYSGMVASQPGLYAIFIDDKYLGLPFGDPIAPTFTPDGKHFVFAGRASVQGQPYPFMVIYVDGRPAARFNGSANQIMRNSYTWEMGADGVLTFLVQDESDIKRVRITMPTDTSVDTMLADARPIPAK
jgi:hypothetical protein